MMTQEKNRDQYTNGVEMSATEHHAARMPTARARQGVAPGHLRYMLAIGLTLVIIAFVIIYFLNA